MLKARPDVLGHLHEQMKMDGTRFVTLHDDHPAWGTGKPPPVQVVEPPTGFFEIHHPVCKGEGQESHAVYSDFFNKMERIFIGSLNLFDGLLELGFV